MDSLNKLCAYIAASMYRFDNDISAGASTVNSEDPKLKMYFAQPGGIGWIKATFHLRRIEPFFWSKPKWYLTRVSMSAAGYTTLPDVWWDDIPKSVSSFIAEHARDLLEKQAADHNEGIEGIINRALPVLDGGRA